MLLDSREDLITKPGRFSELRAVLLLCGQLIYPQESSSLRAWGQAEFLEGSSQRAGPFGTVLLENGLGSVAMRPELERINSLV